MTPLILLPTRDEQRLLPRELAGLSHCCGFGPIATAARTSQLIAQHRPQRVILVGIAGGFSARVDIGTALLFSEVACWGVGAGSGEQFQSASQMGWSHYDDTEVGAIGDRLSLTTLTTETTNLLLSGCSASGNSFDARARLAVYPDAVAEDMEGFAAAVACKLAGIPLTIIRGISNEAGDRNHDTWKIDKAMESASALLRSQL